MKVKVAAIYTLLLFGDLTHALMQTVNVCFATKAMPIHNIADKFHIKHWNFL